MKRIALLAKIFSYFVSAKFERQDEKQNDNMQNFIKFWIFFEKFVNFHFKGGGGWRLTVSNLMGFQGVHQFPIACVPQKDGGMFRMTGLNSKIK